MRQTAPLELTESWDNTGLLIGDAEQSIERLLTCLTLTPATVSEAIQDRSHLVIAHHPLPFKPIRQVTTDSVSGRLLWDLTRHSIAVYSPHTAWDSAEDGINAQLARMLEIQDPAPLVATDGHTDPGLGAGRWGYLSAPTPLAEIVDRLRQHIPHCRPRGWDSGLDIRQPAVACGSGGSFLTAATKQGCDLLVTGEATFHQCLEAEATGTALLMIGHFASEKFAMNHLAEQLASSFPDIQCRASQLEQDPVSLW